MATVSWQRSLGFSAALVAALSACGGEATPGEQVAEQRGALVNGMLASVAQNPATVAVYHGFTRPCSGTLLRPSWVLTARHCLTVDETASGAFKSTNQVWIGPPNVVTATHAQNPGYYPPASAIGAYRFVEYQPGVDLALVELWSPMAPPDPPSCDPGWDPYCVPETAPPRAMGLWNGDTSDLPGVRLLLMGYGRSCNVEGPQCDEANGTSGAGTLRMGETTVSKVRGYSVSSNSGAGIPSTYSGDSGGPSYSITDRLGRNLYGLAAWHIAASNNDGSTVNFRAWIKRTTSFSGTVLGGSRPDIALVGGPWSTFHWASSLGSGTFNRYTASGYTDCDWYTGACTTFDLSSFAWAAQQPGVKSVGGDFSGDNRLDIALVGGGYPDVQIAYSFPDGSFLTGYAGAGGFQALAQTSGALPLSGDFNGDGRTDMALVGGSGWGSIPVAFSKNGTFVVTNTAVASFPGWSREGGVKAVTGDFDGDGRDDIALTGNPYWSTIRIAHSNGDGAFTVTDQYVSGFPQWSPQTSKVVAGDFNGDGRDDIALTGGPGWSTLPVAFSAGGGNFWVKNVGVGDFPVFAQQSGAKAVAGDFDGDGREDIALTGGIGWNTLPVAFSVGDGGFRVTNSSAGTFPSLAQASTAMPFAVDGGGPGRAVHRARELAGARHADGRLEIVYIGVDGQLYRNQQLAPGSTGWSGEIPIIGGAAKRIALAQNQDGRLELFFIGLNDAIYHLWQVTPNGPWSDGYWLGGWAKEIAVTRSQDGRLEVFYAGTNDYFYRNYQTAPNGSWSGEQFFGGAGKRLALEQNLSGGLELYVIGTDDAVYRNYQPSLGAGFSGWIGLGGKARELAVGRYQDGRFQVFYIAGDGAPTAPTSIRTNYQLTDGSWSGDSGLSATGSIHFRSLKIAVDRTSDDRLALISLGSNGTLSEFLQTMQNSSSFKDPTWNQVTSVASMAVVPASAGASSQLLHLGWDRVVHAEDPGSSPGSRAGDRLIGEPLREEPTIVCGTANEWESVTLSCPAGTTVVGQSFASYGTPGGSCSTGFSYGSCDSGNTTKAVEAACLGKSSCTLNANNDTFSPDPCVNVYKRLHVKLICL